MDKTKTAPCGCKIVNGQITELCDRSKAGFQLVEISKKVDGDGEFWAQTIMSELRNHAKECITHNTKKILTLNG